MDNEEEVSEDHADLNETLASIKGRGKNRTLSKRAIRRGVRLALYSKFKKKHTHTNKGLQ